MRRCCQLYTRVVLSKNFSFSPDALWRCCSYWFHLCELSLYSNSELKAPPCPHLIRLLERYSASVKFLQPRQRHCSMKLKPPNHNSLCCCHCCGLLCDCRAQRYLDKRFYLFIYFFNGFILCLYLLSFYHRLFWLCPCVYAFFFFLWACTWECLLVFMRSVYIVYMSAQDAHIHVCIFMGCKCKADSYSSDWGILLPSIEPHEA